MALPPTGLTSVLARANTPAAMYEALRADGCLAAGVPGAPGPVTALIAATLTRHAAACAARAPGWAGPSAVDDVAAQLVGSPHLSAHGRRLHATSYARAGTVTRRVVPTSATGAPPRAWWRFWR